MADEHSESGTKIERDHPQTRKAESDARGSAIWNEEVVDPNEGRAGDEGTEPAGAARRQSDEPGQDRDVEARKISDMADEAEAVRKEAVGARSGGEALGSSAGREIGSGTEPDRGELGGGEPMAEEGTSSPAGARSPGGDSRE